MFSAEVESALATGSMVYVRDRNRDEYTDGHKSPFSEVKGKSPYAWVGCSFRQENWSSKKSVWLRKLPAFSTPKVYLIR